MNEKSHFVNSLLEATWNWFIVRLVSKRKLLLLSCPVYLFLYMGDAFLTSFYSLYFIERGVSQVEQSLLLGVIPFALMMGCILMSMVSKSRTHALWLFRICVIAEFGLSIGLAFANSFASLMVIVSLLSFFNGAPFNFIEGYIVPSVRETNTKYSFIRVFGTIGYIVALLLGFFLLKSFPLNHCYFYASGLLAFAAIVSFFFPTILSGVDGKRLSLAEMKKAETPFWNRNLVLILAATLLIFGVFNATAYLLPVRLYELGIDSSNYSLYRSISMGVEMVMMLTFPLLYKWLKTHRTKILIGGILCMLSSLVGSFIADGVALAVVSFVFAGIGKAFFFGHFSLFLAEYCSENQLGKALSINNATMNMSTALMNLLSSTIYESLGFLAYFGIMAAIEALGLVLFVFVAFYLKGNNAGDKVPA